jgi:outer membrane receptor protein involved in Fe transport
MNLRLAYNTTLARPEIREMTNVFDFDPFQQALVVGNPSLINQHTRSYDFRWEWFPHTREVLAVSLFGKQIDNQLEKVFALNTAGTSATFPEFPTISYRNNPNRGKVWGVELEVVKDLGRITSVLQNFYAGTNISLVQSDVVKTNERLEAARIIDRQSPKNSPLFEQAPYSINAYINYTNQKSGSDVSVNFNMVGERLIQISMDGTPDVYSNPVEMLDLVWSQKITRRLLFKGYAKNLLNAAFEETYNNPGTGSTFYGNKYIRRSYKRGTEWMAGFTYQLF